MNKSDNAKTYSKKNPVLVQKVLTFNKEDGKSPKKVKEEQLVKEEVEEKEYVRVMWDVGARLVWE